VGSKFKYKGLGASQTFRFRAFPPRLQFLAASIAGIGATFLDGDLALTTGDLLWAPGFFVFMLAFLAVSDRLTCYVKVYEDSLFFQEFKDMRYVPYDAITLIDERPGGKIRVSYMHEGQGLFSDGPPYETYFEVALDQPGLFLQTLRERVETATAA
jgi:hypothetical protein